MYRLKAFSIIHLETGIIKMYRLTDRIKVLIQSEIGISAIYYHLI